MATNKKSITTEKKVIQNELKQSSFHTVGEFRQLYRSKKNCIIAGVAGGIGEYFHVDPLIIRLLFILSSIFGGFGLPIYIILWILLPQGESGQVATQQTMTENVQDIRHKAETFAASIRSNVGTAPTQGRNTLALVLIVFGLIFLLANFRLIHFDVIWPGIFILFGLYLLTKK